MQRDLHHLSQYSQVGHSSAQMLLSLTATTYDCGIGDQRIRPLALALVRRHDEILVERGRDEKKDETFFRPLGGTIEFGERGAEAIRRELREELASDIGVGALVATIENLFTWEGRVRHEIILVFECTLNDANLYLLDEWDVHEDTPVGGMTHQVAWKRVDSFGPGQRLYPTELIALLRAN